MFYREVFARRQAPAQAKLRHDLTAPAGGWRRETERRRAGERRIELTVCDNLVFQIRTARARISLFLGRGRRGADWKGAATRVPAKERADWAKATRSP